MTHLEVFSVPYGLDMLIERVPWFLWAIIGFVIVSIIKPNPLPTHLAKRTHNDWPAWFRWVPRAWNAYGARSGGVWRWLFPDRPRVLIAWNCPRWMTPGDKSVVIIDRFDKAWVFPWMSQTVEAFETKSENPAYLKTRRVAIRYYGPSPIQSDDRTKASFQITYPFHVAFHFDFVWAGMPRMVYGRCGFRWDSLDRYYNLGPYLGLAFE